MTGADSTVLDIGVEVKEEHLVRQRRQGAPRGAERVGDHVPRRKSRGVGHQTVDVLLVIGVSDEGDVGRLEEWPARTDRRELVQTAGQVEQVGHTPCRRGPARADGRPGSSGAVRHRRTAGRPRHADSPRPPPGGSPTYSHRREPAGAVRDPSRQRSPSWSDRRPLRRPASCWAARRRGGVPSARPADRRGRPAGSLPRRAVRRYRRCARPPDPAPDPASGPPRWSAPRGVPNSRRRASSPSSRRDGLPPTVRPFPTRNLAPPIRPCTPSRGCKNG